MKKVILSLVVVAATLVSCKENKKDKVKVNEEVKVEKTAEAVNNVDVSTSTLLWVGSKPTGSHNGKISLKSGSLVVENGVVKSGEFVVDMTTIENLDMKPGDGKEDLQGHLNSADFFDVAKYPTAKFVITSSEAKDGKLTVTGNLTIKEITKSITIPATVSEANGIVTFKSDIFKVDRTDFGVTYKSKKINAKLKDKFINDLMEISFEVKSTK